MSRSEDHPRRGRPTYSALGAQGYLGRPGVETEASLAGKSLHGQIHVARNPSPVGSTGYTSLLVCLADNCNITLAQSHAHLKSKYPSHFPARWVSRHPWRDVTPKCPQQANGYDCGVQVIANALFQMTGTKC